MYGLGQPAFRALYQWTYALTKENREDITATSVTTIEGNKHAYDSVYSWLAIVLLHK